MKYILPFFLVFIAGVSSAQTPNLYDTWSPVILGTVVHVTITEHQLILKYPNEGITKNLPEFMALPSPDQGEVADLPVETAYGKKTEKSDTMQVLKVVYDSARAKGRIFLSTKKDSKFIIPLKFLLTNDGEISVGIADGFMDVFSKDLKTLKQVEKATRNPVKKTKASYRNGRGYNSELDIFGWISFKFYNSNRTAEFAKLKDATTMPKQELIGMIGSFGNRISAYLQTAEFDSLGNPVQGFGVFGPVLVIAQDLFIAHGYNPLGIAEIFDKLKDDSDIKVTFDEVGKRVEESVPALREAKARREAIKAQYASDTSNRISNLEELTPPPNDDGTVPPPPPQEVVEKPVQDEMTKEEAPSKDEFIEVTKEPQPITPIQSLVVYPEKARKSGLEGRVTFSVLIGKDGKPQKVSIDQSDDHIFDQAVTEAVMKTKFTPAIGAQNEPVRVWYTQSVSFKLTKDTMLKEDRH